MKRRCDICGEDNKDISWPGAKVFSCGHFACSNCGYKYSRCQVASCHRK